MSAEFRIDILIPTNQVGCFLEWLQSLSCLCSGVTNSMWTHNCVFFFSFVFSSFFFSQLLLTLMSVKKICINEDKSGKLAW